MSDGLFVFFYCVCLIVKISDKNTVTVTATVKTKAQTGVEMEALTAVSVALLTVWDMTKQYEKDAAGQYPSTAIENIHVVRKFKQQVPKA